MAVVVSLEASNSGIYHLTKSRGSAYGSLIKSNPQHRKIGAEHLGAHLSYKSYNP